MPHQYAAIAARSEQVDRVVGPYQEQVEFPSLLRALGPVADASVLDLGCGWGSFSRLLRRHGASRVLGVDSCAEMIELALRRERDEPTGVRYRVHDIATMPVLGAFDIVIAANVLHYARHRDALARMGERAFANLAPGGRLFALVGNPDALPETRQLNGFVLHRPVRPPDGFPFTISVPTAPPSRLAVHYWSRRAYEDVLNGCGFADLTWEPMVGLPGDGPDQPVNLLMSARRP